MLTTNLYQIHVVEDSQADFLALRRAISVVASELDTTVAFQHHADTSAAYETLLDGRRVDLMFIDINLPGENGIGFLRRVKADARIVPFPKIILTTSTSEDDVKNSFQEGAAGYLVKPLEYGALLESVRKCLTYWFRTSRLPSVKERDDFPRC